jgi:polysaccharide export outer membrane protein
MKRLSEMGIILLLVVVLFLLGCGKKEVRPLRPDESKVTGGGQYVIGPEDVLRIEVWKEANLSGTVPVRSDGKISLPLIHDTKAAGLTPLQLQESLVRKLKEFIESPNVSVTVVEANSFRVYVSGQVRTPGVFRLRAETNLLQVISMAGGFTEWANPKKILIIRKENGGEQRIIANHKKMADGKEPILVVKPGDTVIVP